MRFQPISAIRSSLLTAAASLLTTALLPAAPPSDGFTFDLTKRNDYAELLHVGGGYLFKISHWDKASDETTVTSKIGPITPEPGATANDFTLVDSSGGSEVRLEVSHLSQPYRGGIVNNRGEWALEITGHGPAFEEVRRAIVDHRMSDDWKGDGDLTLHGVATGMVAGTPMTPPPTLTYADADAHLNRSYKALRSRLNAAEKQALLVQQRAWLQQLDPVKDIRARTQIVQMRAQEFDLRLMNIGR